MFGFDHDRVAPGHELAHCRRAVSIAALVIAAGESPWM